LLIDIGLGFNGKAIGVSYWYDPGATRNGWWGFCSVLMVAAFAYSGSEMVGLTASEQENPRRDMPKAIAKVFWRVGIVGHCYFCACREFPNTDVF
jgi:amino acid transporter